MGDCATLTCSRLLTPWRLHAGMTETWVHIKPVSMMRSANEQGSDLMVPLSAPRTREASRSTGRSCRRPGGRADQSPSKSSTSRPVQSPRGRLEQLRLEDVAGQMGDVIVALGLGVVIMLYFLKCSHGFQKKKPPKLLNCSSGELFVSFRCQPATMPLPCPQRLLLY